jgi:predicted nucleic acid-binding protein
MVEAQGAIVPAFFHLEIANVLLLAERGGRMSVEAREQRLQQFAAMQFIVDPETVSRAWSDTIALARRYSLVVYDAAYLEVAVRTGSMLATLDEKLAAAGRKQRLEVVP